MSDPVYENLRARLDIFPTGLPGTAEGIEIGILKRLFSRDEAEIAVHLPLFAKDDPERAANIARRMQRDKAEVEKALRHMAENTLVYMHEDDGVCFYALLQFLPEGSWSLNADKLDPELSMLFEKYLQGALGRQMAGKNISLTRVIPISRGIDPKNKSSPHDDAIRAIKTSSSLCVLPCVCRTQQNEIGKHCRHTLETCLYLNHMADYLNAVGKGGVIITVS